MIRSYLRIWRLVCLLLLLSHWLLQLLLVGVIVIVKLSVPLIIRIIKLGKPIIPVRVGRIQFFLLLASRSELLGSLLELLVLGGQRLRIPVFKFGTGNAAFHNVLNFSLGGFYAFSLATDFHHSQVAYSILGHENVRLAFLGYLSERVSIVSNDSSGF